MPEAAGEGGCGMIEEPGWNQDMIEMQCAHCDKPLLPEKAMGCVCAKYGYPGHEERGWCSEECMEADHPGD